MKASNLNRMYNKEVLFRFFPGMIFICINLSGTLHAQKEIIRFQRLSIEDGLSQNTINCILQDSKGFMWFGTQDGLNQYDGYSFTIYKHDPDNPNSLAHDFVRAIYEDSLGILWIGTDGGGLNRFDPTTVQFTRYQHDANDPNSLSNNYVYSIREDRLGHLWIGTYGGGLNRFHRNSEQFTHYQHDPDNPNSLSDNRVWSLWEDGRGKLWIGTDGGGLNMFDPRTKRFTRYQHDQEDANSLSGNRIWTIFEDHSNNLWFGTWDAGLNVMDPTGEKFIRYQHDPNASNSVSNNDVLMIFEDQTHALWVGTRSGLNKLDRATNQFIRYENDPNDPTSVSHDYIFSGYEDRVGDLWIGTMLGISRFNRNAKPFRHYQHDRHDPNSISENTIMSLYEDNSGAVWIGTWGGGLNRYDPLTERITHFQHDPQNSRSLSNNIVLSICQGSDTTLWVGTYGGGLNRLAISATSSEVFDPENVQFTHYKHDANNPNSLSNNSIWRLYQDKSGALWIGTDGGGLNKLVLSTSFTTTSDSEKGQQFIRYKHDPNNPNSLSSNFIREIYEDRSGSLWIGTDSGADKFDRASEQFMHYQHDPDNPLSLSNNLIRVIYEKSDEVGRVLWIGTNGGGLNRLDRKTGEIRRFTEKNGLPNNVVYSILEDDHGNLWISTNAGICKFNPATGKIKSYDVTDGLQGNEFNRGAYYKSKTGEMFFGGLNGFNVFHPDSIRDNPFIPPVVITNFKIFNKAVPVGEGRGGRTILNKSITDTDAIELSYEDYVFSFEFAALTTFYLKKASTLI